MLAFLCACWFVLDALASVGVAYQNLLSFFPSGFVASRLHASIIIAVGKETD